MFLGFTACGSGKASDLVRAWGLHLADHLEAFGFSEFQLPHLCTGRLPVLSASHESWDNQVKQVYGVWKPFVNYKAIHLGNSKMKNDQHYSQRNGRDGKCGSMLDTFRAWCGEGIKDSEFVFHLDLIIPRIASPINSSTLKNSPHTSVFRIPLTSKTVF